MAGRKSLKTELKMFDRYSELSVPYFRVLKKHLTGSNVANEKWAVEQLTKAFTKMIPTEVSGVDGKPIPILMHMNVPAHNSNPKDSQP
jgi:hypothetical protein